MPLPPPPPRGASAPLGVFDSGVGGLTVLKELRRALPHESFVYLGDTARVPYGPKPPEMVRGFATEIAHALLGRGVKGIVIACNTASAAALPELADRLPVPTWGVVEPGVAAALGRAPGGRIGVLGTQGTVASRVYQDRLERAGAITWARACPLFVPIVEEGVSDTAIARLVASHYLEGRPPLDAVILGCTHYPALKGVLAEVLGEGVTLIDSAEAVAAVVARDLRRLGLLAPAGGRAGVRYLVTGDVPSFLHAAEVLGGPAGTYEQLPVTDLSLGPAERAR
ncbi:MAG: glutamate racemase [Deinococcales bacterium]|nr:glutamate racemase [Deinococcales bacterium]